MSKKILSLDLGITSIGYFIVGYALMFGTGNGFMGSKGWFLLNAESSAGLPLYAFWLFQAAFCATFVLAPMICHSPGRPGLIVFQV